MTETPTETSRWARLGRLIREAGRRRVLPVGAVYFVSAWLLVEVASVVLPTFDAPRWMLRSLIIAVVAGFPVAIVLAWIFDITPRGIVRTKTQIEPDSKAQPKKLAIDATQTKIVAALPFVNRSPLEDDAFFADGMHDELLMRISTISAIQVISRTSVMRYRDTLKSIPEIAAELGAAVVLEGAVQRSGTRVRVIAQLIDGATDVHLWAQTFDRELTTDNLFEIQAEITRLIATELHAALSGADEAVLKESAPTQSLAAYDAYLRGRLLARSEAAGEREIRQAIETFDTAIAADPKFAEPQAGKARAQLTLYWFFGWDKHWVEAARDAVARAQALAPLAVETQLAEAYYHYWGKLDYEHAETALNKVLARAPGNPEAWACKAYVVRRAGRLSECIEALEKALRLNPMLIDLPMELATTLASVGRFDEADLQLNHVRALAPNSPFTAYYAGDVGYWKGRSDLAWNGASHPVDEVDFVYLYRRVFHAINTRDAEKIRLALDDWPANFHRTASFPATFEMYRAMALTSLGRDDEAGAVLDEISSLLGNLPDPYPGGWAPDAPYFPVTLPGLLRDLGQVQRAADDYDKNAPRDDFAKINHYHAIATAFVLAGDNTSALDYLQRLLPIFGPPAYLPMSITPAYDTLRNDPRYQKIASAYETWNKNREVSGFTN